VQSNIAGAYQQYLLLSMMGIFHRFAPQSMLVISAGILHLICSLMKENIYKVGCFLNIICLCIFH
jgi:hypothetical protein